MPGGSPWPQFSIVTPSFNQAAFLEETIRSVLLQGYPSLEYFIIDGASSDSSVELIKEYQRWLAGWVSEPDRGQSHAINKGFSRCTGDLVTFQNSDDFYLPGAFQDAGQRWAQEKGAGMVVGGFHYVDGFKMRQTAIPATLPHPGPIDLGVTLDPWRLHQVSVFYATHALDQVGRSVREDLHYNMDRELLYRVSRQYKTLLSPRAYGAFRWHADGKSISNMFKADMEYADLNLSYHYDDPASERLKRIVANRRRAKGYVRFARMNGAGLDSLRALVKALRYDPALLLRMSYYGNWLRGLGCRPNALTERKRCLQIP